MCQRHIYVLTQAYAVYFHFVVKSCFPSQTKIRLENGEIVTMSELQEGDKVQTGKKLQVQHQNIKRMSKIISYAQYVKQTHNCNC